MIQLHGVNTPALQCPPVNSTFVVKNLQHAPCIAGAAGFRLLVKGRAHVPSLANNNWMPLVATFASFKTIKLKPAQLVLPSPTAAPIANLHRCLRNEHLHQDI